MGLLLLPNTPSTSCLRSSEFVGLSSSVARIALLASHPGADFAFNHALEQDIAYESLLHSQREKLHARIATTLEQRFPDLVETEPETLAHHYAAAGRAESSFPYWRRAAQRAFEGAAHVEAVGHYTRGLEALEMLPEDRHRAEEKIAMLLPLADCLGAMGRSAEATGARQRAAENAERHNLPMGDGPGLRAGA